MPINADYEYNNALKKYDEAKTTEEKVAALELMRSTAPSHKGAEKLRIDISKRLTKMKEKLEQERQKRGGSKTMTVKKDGAAQVVLVGLPNSGKSTILKSITNADPLIAPYEFTTIEPEIGVMDYKGAQIQIVEVPALIKDSVKGKARGREKLGIIRNSDFIILTAIGNF
jgi:ribosome-interacting GTPase 1